MIENMNEIILSNKDNAGAIVSMVNKINEIIDWIHMMPEKVEEKYPKEKTLSDNLEELKRFSLNTYQSRRLQARIISGENKFNLIMEKEREQVERCEEYFKEHLKEFIDWIIDEGVYQEGTRNKANEIFGERLIK